MCLIFSGVAFSSEYQYERAIDMHPDKIVRVARFMRSVQEMGDLSKERDGLRDIPIDIRVDGRVFGFVAKEDGIVHVVLNNGAFSGFAPHDGEDMPKLQGVVNARLNSLAGALATPSINSFGGGFFDWERDSIVVSGIREAGAVASLLGVAIKKSYRGKQTLQKNQVKVIMFNPPSIGDAELIASVHREIGITNILNFRRSTSIFGDLYGRFMGVEELCGVPLSLHQSTESRKETLSTTLTVLGYSLLAYSVYSYPSYSPPVPELLFSLPGSLASVLATITPLAQERIQNAFSEVLSVALSAEMNRVCNTARSTAMQFFLVGSICLLIKELSYKIPPTPSDCVVRELIRRTQKILREDGLEALFTSSSKHELLP